MFIDIFKMLLSMSIGPPVTRQQPPRYMNESKNAAYTIPQTKLTGRFGTAFI